MNIEDLNILIDEKLNPIAASLKECKQIASSILSNLEDCDQSISKINLSLDSIEKTFSESDAIFKNFERHHQDMYHQLQIIANH